MGRAPCCDKANVKKGPWSPEEDAKLKSYIEQHGTGGNWIALPQKIGLKRCGKSCRLRWLNYLRPNIKHGGFSEEEDNIICSLYISIGSRWSIIAAQLPGRTDNDIKNYWNTRLKKKLFGKQRQARSLKQEMIRKTSDQNYPSIMGSDHDHNINNPNELLPAPVPYSNLQAGFNDHASIRKLLIKLGGRFSDDQSIQPPYQALADTTYASDQLVLANTQYNTDGEGGLQMMMLPDHQSSFSPADQEMIFNPQRLDIGMGMEFLYDQNGIAFGESNYWGGSGTTSSDHDQLVAAASNNYYI